MSSPAMRPSANTETVEDMPRWHKASFEAPNVNGQKFSGSNNPDWGANHYNESRRRNTTRPKPHHHSKRGSGSGYQQAPWSNERGPAPAPASPQWQPQLPPQASQNYTGFQEPQGPASVNLSNLPATLCRRNFLEAMLDQAGLADDIMGCVLGENQQTGTAVIYLANFNSALKCVQHFGGRRWDSAGPPVMAQVADEAASTSKPASRQTTEPAANDNLNNQEQMKMIAMPAPAFGAYMVQPMLPLLQAMHNYNKGNNNFPTNGGNSTPTSGSGSDSPKKTASGRWADAEDEGNHEQDNKGSGSEGLEDSTSAGSTGRYREESFSFGCDVDTDDGF